MKKKSLKFKVQSSKLSFLYLLFNISFSLFTLHSSLFIAFASDTPLEEFLIPTPFTFPSDILVDRHGIVWVMEFNVNKIGRFDPLKNLYEEFDITTSKSDSFDMEMDRQGNIWFAEQLGNQIAKFNTKTLQFTEFELPVPDSNPTSITIDSKGNIWFVEWYRNKITKFTPPPNSPPLRKERIKGRFKEYDIPTPMSQSAGLVSDKKDNIWFVEKGANKLAMLNTGTGKFKEYKIQPDFSFLVGTAVDSKGDVWFIKMKYKKLVKFNPVTEEFTEFSLPGKKGAQNIIIDKNDNIWISMKLDDKIARFDPVTKIFSDYDMPTKDSQPQAITTDSVGNVWFATLKGNRIGRLDISKIGKTAKESELKIKIAPPEIFKR